MVYDPCAVKPLNYPLALSPVRRTCGKDRFLQIVDAEGKSMLEVAYYDRRPAEHLESMRLARAVVDSMNHYRIDISTDGRIKEPRHD